MNRSSMKMTVRAMRADDADAIARLHSASWRDSYRTVMREEYLKHGVESERRGFWRSRLAVGHQDERGWLALMDSESVGFIYLLGCTDPEWGSRIDNLHVSEGARGRGIGRALVATACEWVISDLGDSGVFLWVYADNPYAVDFYVRIGGTCVEEEVREVPGSGEALEFRYAWQTASELLSNVAPKRAT